MLKVLELYLGLPNYMNEHGEYPSYFFYDLSMTLKFRTVTMMLEAVKLSESFGWKPDESQRNMVSFSSPLWKAKDAKSAESIEDLPANLHAKLQAGSNNYYNINNNISTQHAASLPEGNPSEEGRKFFHEINTNPAEKAEMLEPLIRFFQE